MFGGEGVYWIRNRHLPTKLIDIRNAPYIHAGERSAKQVGLFSPQFVPTQLWLVEQVEDGEHFVIRNYHTGEVLSIENDNSRDGTPMVARPYDIVHSQHWKIAYHSHENKVPYYTIANQKTQSVVDQTRDTSNNTDFAVVSCHLHGGINQQWSFERAVLPKMYWFINVHTGLYLEWEPSTSDATYFGSKSQLPRGSQLWYLENYTDDPEYFAIRNVQYEDKVLDLSASDNQTLVGWPGNAHDNQKWKLVDVDFNGIVSIVCKRDSSVVYAKKAREIWLPRCTVETEQFSDTFKWKLVACPIPPLFWTTLQSKEYEGFIDTNRHGLLASKRFYGTTDFTAQWRFISEGQKHCFSITNRNYRTFMYSSTPTVGLDGGPVTDKRPWGLWALHPAGDDVGIRNLSTSKDIVHVNETIQAINNGSSEPNGEWFVSAAIDVIPSFSIVNCETGMALAYVPNVTEGSVVVNNTYNAYRSQWIFQQVGVDESGRAMYAIINRLSHQVLDHWAGQRIEALSDDTLSPNHRWSLVPCHNKYYAIVNVATKEYLYHDDQGLETKNGIPGMTDHDRKCCWLLVSHRYSDIDFDVVVVDPEISQPYRTIHQIVKRADRNQENIPRAGRITQLEPGDIFNLFERLIGQWDQPTLLPTNNRITRLLTLTENDVARWRIDLSNRLRNEWRRSGPGWIRIDQQGVIERDGVQFANVQGQYGTHTVFHVEIPMNVRLGVQAIQDAMLLSLREGRTVRFNLNQERPNNSKKKPNTTRRPPGPGPPGGGGWTAALTGAAIAWLGLAVLSG